ncbi:MAG: DUF6134 family protein [Pseudomonadales bacterium]
MRPELLRAPGSVAAVALLLIACAGAAQALTFKMLYQFEVYYDDRRIGEHVFEVQRHGDETLVRSNAEFEYRILRIPLYRYRHEALERWQQGCLTGLQSSTNDNGRSYEVQLNGPDLGADCAASYAYWDLTLLQRDVLVNAQTGATVQVRLSFAGEDRVRGQPALRYRLESAGGSPIQLWYDANDGHWLQLEVQRDGGTLRYRLSQPPVTAPSGGTDAAAWPARSGLEQHAGIQDAFGIEGPLDGPQ